MSLSLFLIRGERTASAAEPRVLGSAGGGECRAAVHLFHNFEQYAVVLPTSWGKSRQPVLQSFWDKAEWETDIHYSHQRTSQLFAHFLLPDNRLRHLSLCYRSTVLPTHLQPVHKPTAGWASPLQVTRNQRVPKNICLA